METRGFFQSRVNPCVWYREEMVPIFYVGNCLIFSPSKDKIDDVHSSLQEDFKIEDDGNIKKHLGVELYRLPDLSIHLSQPYLDQIIINRFVGMDKSIA